MKKWIWMSLLMAGLGGVSAYGSEPQEVPSVTLQTSSDTLSYALGRLIGTSLMRSDSAMLRQNLNQKVFFEAVAECLSGQAGRMSDQEATLFLQQYKKRWNQKQQEAIQQVGEDFLAANRKQPGVKTTFSGLQYRIVKKGEGARPTPTDVVRIYYTMKRTDGTVIDSSDKRGIPMDTPLRNLIPGVIEGMQLMPLGAKYIFYLPSKLAYGSRGAGDQVRPNEALIFEVELLDIEAGSGAGSTAAPMGFH